jgi:hypothetical protein
MFANKLDRFSAFDDGAVRSKGRQRFHDALIARQFPAPALLEKIGEPERINNPYPFCTCVSSQVLAAWLGCMHLLTCKLLPSRVECFVWDASG